MSAFPWPGVTAGSPSTLPVQTPGVMGAQRTDGAPGALPADQGTVWIFLRPESSPLWPSRPPLPHFHDAWRSHLLPKAPGEQLVLKAAQGGEAQLPVETLAPRWPRLVPWSPPPIHPVSPQAWEVPSALGCCDLPHGFLGQPEPHPSSLLLVGGGCRSCTTVRAQPVRTSWFPGWQWACTTPTTNFQGLQSPKAP